jgi:hypothetical protein
MLREAALVPFAVRASAQSRRPRIATSDPRVPPLAARRCRSDHASFESRSPSRLVVAAPRLWCGATTSIRPGFRRGPSAARVTGAVSPFERSPIRADHGLRRAIHELREAALVPFAVRASSEPRRPRIAASDPRVPPFAARRCRSDHASFESRSPSRHVVAAPRLGVARPSRSAPDSGGAQRPLESRGPSRRSSEVRSAPTTDCDERSTSSAKPPWCRSPFERRPNRADHGSRRAIHGSRRSPRAAAEATTRLSSLALRAGSW